jgi:hypothetical protein
MQLHPRRSSNTALHHRMTSTEDLTRFTTGGVDWTEQKPKLDSHRQIRLDAYRNAPLPDVKEAAAASNSGNKIPANGFRGAQPSTVNRIDSKVSLGERTSSATTTSRGQYPKKATGKYTVGGYDLGEYMKMDPHGSDYTSRLVSLANQESSR